MTTLNPNDILVTALAVALLWYYVAFRFRRVFVEDLRLKLFQLRDRAFFVMLENGVSMHSHDYRLLRRRLNASIRSAEVFGLGAFVLAKAMGLARPMESELDVTPTFEDLPPQVAMDLQKVWSEHTDSMMLHVLLGSPATLFGLASATLVLPVLAYAVGGVRALLAMLAGMAAGYTAAYALRVLPRVARRLLALAQAMADAPDSGGDQRLKLA